MQNSNLHWVQVKCMHPPLVKAYRNLQFGQVIPCSARCFSTPLAWLSGSLASFQAAKSSQDNPSCVLSHYHAKIKMHLHICHIIYVSHRQQTFGTWHCPAIRTYQFLISGVSDESGRALDSPKQKLWEISDFIGIYLPCSTIWSWDLSLGCGPSISFETNRGRPVQSRVWAIRLTGQSSWRPNHHHRPSFWAPSKRGK